jgi:hypothetical protein
VFTEYLRSPCSALVDATVSPIFLETVPDRNPRSECGCQLVAFSNSCALAPPGRFSISRIVAVLLPSRASFRALLGAFNFGAAFFPALTLTRVTWARTCASGGPFSGLRLRRRLRLFCSQNHFFSLGGDHRNQ